MKQINLTNEEYDLLVAELGSLHSYHWNDDTIHADNCGSKALPILEQKTTDVSDEPFGGSHAPDCPYRLKGECNCWRSDPDQNPELDNG